MEVEKQKLESEKQTFLLQQEEMENHQKTEKNRQIADLEDQVLNLSSGLLTRNEEISQLREEIESQKRDLLTLEGCISTLTESKKLEEESSSNLKVSRKKAEFFQFAFILIRCKRCVQKLYLHKKMTLLIFLK